MKAIVTLVHGTWAPAAQWTSPDSPLCSSLRRAAAQMNYQIEFHTHTWSGAEAPDLWVFNLNLGLVRTQKTRLTLNYIHRYSDQDDPVDRFALDGSWDLSQAVSFQTRMNYTMAESNSWSVDAYLTLRL